MSSYIKKYFSMLIVASSVLSCGLNTSSFSQTETDLGPVGNEKVRAVYAKYTRKASGCLPKESADVPRVMVTGFGLFAGAAFNISGAVVANMADENFFPAQVNTDEAFPASPRIQLGATRRNDSGGRAYVRTLTVDNQKIEVCFVVLDVVWDLGAAIVLYEAERFRPDFIIMTGRGAETNRGIVEWGAVNKAVKTGSYNSSGDYQSDLTPISDFVLPKYGDDAPPEVVRTSWDAARIRDIAGPVVERSLSDNRIVAEDEARSNNDYICNNIAYVVLNALEGRTVKLAGETIESKSSLRRTGAGFFHFPVNAEFEPVTIATWGRFIAKMMTEVVNREEKFATFVN